MDLYRITESVHGDFTTLTLLVDGEFYVNTKTFQTSHPAGFASALKALTDAYVAWTKTF